MKKLFAAVLSCLFLCASVAVYGGEWSFSSVLDFAYYPKSDYISGGTHFAPVTGPYDGLQFQDTIHAKYTVMLPFGTGALLKGNNVVIDAGLTANIVSITPKISVSFTPVAFCTVSAGAMAGTGWNAGSFQGMASYNPAKREYTNLDPFKTWYTNLWACGTLQFDAAALWPGEWHHIIAVASCEIDFVNLVNAGSDCDVWEWATTKGLADGLQYVQNYILAYRLPRAVSMVGVNISGKGHFNKNDYAELYDDYNGSFMQIDVNPLMQVLFTKKDSVYFMLNFKTRRSFEEAHNSEDDEPLLTYSGSEFILYRLALSWTHTF